MHRKDSKFPCWGTCRLRTGVPNTRKSQSRIRSLRTHGSKERRVGKERMFAPTAHNWHHKHEGISVGQGFSHCARAMDALAWAETTAAFCPFRHLDPEHTCTGKTRNFHAGGPAGSELASQTRGNLSQGFVSCARTDRKSVG